MNDQNDKDLQFSQVAEIVERLRPAMQADGGNVEIASVERGIVSVRLLGTCRECPSSNMTVKEALGRTIKDGLPWVSEVMRVP